MEIYLINGKSVTITVRSFDRSDEVLEVNASGYLLAFHFHCLHVHRICSNVYR